MKVQTVLAGLLISAAISSAQVARDRPSTESPPFYPPGGQVTFHVHPSEPVVSLDQAIGMSDLIVDGIVTSVLPSISLDPDPDRPSAETHSVVLITEVLLYFDRRADGLTLLSQTLPAGIKTVLLAQAGGKVGKWDVLVPDVPLVKQGQRYIFFLHSDVRKEPPNTSGLRRYRAVGHTGIAKAENGKIEFVPGADPRLHEHNKTDVSAFIAAVRKRIVEIIPKKQYISPR